MDAWGGRTMPAKYAVTEDSIIFSFVYHDKNGHQLDTTFTAWYSVSQDILIIDPLPNTTNGTFEQMVFFRKQIIE